MVYKSYKSVSLSSIPMIKLDAYTMRPEDILMYVNLVVTACVGSGCI